MLMRVGLPGSTGTLPRKASEMSAPALLSANSLWVPGPSLEVDTDDAEATVTAPGRFRNPGKASDGLDLALDCGGFVAMKLYGGYRWTVAQYVELVSRRDWAWWAAMDFCCEPEISTDRAEVRARVIRTAVSLAECRVHATNQGLTQPPMPVVQGWTPDDYELSIQLTDTALGGDWPAMVGVGSVCRRQWGGTDGLAAVLARIFLRLPDGVGVHLFGVKGSALQTLADNPRVLSADSMAWDFAARKEARAERGSTNMARRVRHMRRFVESWEQGQSRQLGLLR